MNLTIFYVLLLAVFLFLFLIALLANYENRFIAEYYNTGEVPFGCTLISGEGYYKGLQNNGNKCHVKVIGIFVEPSGRKHLIITENTGMYPPVSWEPMTKGEVEFYFGEKMGVATD